MSILPTMVVCNLSERPSSPRGTFSLPARKGVRNSTPPRPPRGELSRHLGACLALPSVRDPPPPLRQTPPSPGHRSGLLPRFPLRMRICRRGHPPSGNAVSVRVSRTLDPGRTRARPRLFDLRPGSTVPVRKGEGERLTKAWT